MNRLNIHRHNPPRPVRARQPKKERRIYPASLPQKFTNILGALVAIASIGALALLVGKPNQIVVARYATSLDGRTKSQRHNADLALARLDGVTVKPGQTFSFNAHVGSFSRDQGYRKAPVSYNGQLVDSWGGGVCQASTTLYNAALLSGMQIVERNRHRFCPSYVEPGRDAAVAYDTIDLKFRNPYDFPVRIHARDLAGKVDVEILAPRKLPAQPQVVAIIDQIHDPAVYLIGDRKSYNRLRNSGKPGFEVSVYRITGNKKELISADSYAPMNRIVEQ